MAFGAIILSVSCAVSVVQNLNKNKAIREFEEQRAGYSESDGAYDASGAEDGNGSEENADFGLDDSSHEGGKNSTPATMDAGESKSVVATGYLVRIPKINCTEPVKEGVDRYALAASLGHEPETVLPGEAGNCVIAGHRNYTFGKYFNRLNEVEVGDTIYVDTVCDTYEYTVEEIKIVEPTDLSVLDNTEDEILTLYTCTPIYIATHRLVIIAKRV